MSDLSIAKANLAGHTICLCKDGNCLYSPKKGIAPMMDFIQSGVDLSGYSVADLVVGKAAAMLFARCKVASVFAQTLSVGGKETLQKFGIPFEYQTLTEKILNRAGTDVCPMEKAVRDTDDADEAYLLLKDRLQALAALSKK